MVICKLASIFHHHCISGNKKMAEKILDDARRLMATQERADISSALTLVDAALELSPGLDVALELKARALLYLHRYVDVLRMLSHCLPACKLPLASVRSDAAGFLWRGCRRREKKGQQWRLLVLGQACCHLGMMEDAAILLQSYCKLAVATACKRSNGARSDKFADPCCSRTDPETHLASTLLSTAKSLQRRRAAGLAALHAGLHSEAARLFSKILDHSKRSNPKVFMAQCFMHRAIAYQHMGRVADAISDCSKALVLKPGYQEALQLRASLFEITRCFPEWLHDLEHLKMSQEALLHDSYDNSVDLRVSLDHLNNQIKQAREKLITDSPVTDCHLMLGLPPHEGFCTRAQVETAFLLLSLKHRPDRSVLFLDRCELADDGRGMDTVLEEARSSSARLFRLIQRAYAEVLSAIAAEELACKRRQKASKVDNESKAGRGEGHHHPMAMEEKSIVPSKTLVADRGKLAKGEEMARSKSNQGGISQLQHSGIIPVATCREAANVGALLTHHLSGVSEPWMVNRHSRSHSHTGWRYQPALQPLPVT